MKNATSVLLMPLILAACGYMTPTPSEERDREQERLVRPWPVEDQPPPPKPIDRNDLLFTPDELMPNRGSYNDPDRVASIAFIFYRAGSIHWGWDQYAKRMIWNEKGKTFEVDPNV